METHAVSGPLSLTNPTPLKATPRHGANHVHASVSFLGRSPALGTGLGVDGDGHRAGVDPLGPGGVDTESQVADGRGHGRCSCLSATTLIHVVSICKGGWMDEVIVSSRR